MGKAGGRIAAQGQGSNENLKLVAIIFVATTVFALGACVLLYTELRKMHEEVDRAEAKVKEMKGKFERQLERAEGFAARCLDDKEGTAEGLDKIFVPGERFNPVVLEEDTDWRPDSLVELVDKLRNKATSLKERNEGLRGDLDDKTRAYKTKEEELKSTRQIKEEEISKLREDLEEERSSARRMAQESEGKVTAMREETRALRKKMVNAEKAHKKKVEKLKVEAENWKMKYEEAVKPPSEVAVFFEFDGKILSVDSRYKMATLDLGRKDGVRPGFAFSVYPPGRPQKESLKGKVAITEVKQNVSTAKTMSEKDANPIMGGDQIYNPLFSRHRKEKFALLGEFKAPHTAEWVSDLIEDHGGIPSREVSDKTNYVILGTDYEHLEEYKRARELGLEVMRIQTLLKFFGRQLQR